MENLNTDEYKHLDESFQKLLPEEKVMFNDSSEDTILIKILKSKISKIKLPNTSEIMSTLLIQYAIVENSETLHLSSKEQREFIDSPLLKYTTLKALNFRKTKKNRFKNNNNQTNNSCLRYTKEKASQLYRACYN
jgi:hypothetical protein